MVNEASVIRATANGDNLEMIELLLAHSPYTDCKESFCACTTYISSDLEGQLSWQHEYIQFTAPEKRKTRGAIVKCFVQLPGHTFA